MEDKQYMMRKTKETEIEMKLNMYGTRQINVQTGIGFFDHMLELMAFHAGFDLRLIATGDIHVDSHHIVEDVGIVLGTIFKQTLQTQGMRRYGQALLPMDETLTLVAVDISNRSYLGFESTFSIDQLGQMATELVEEFFQAFVRHAQITLHIRNLTTKNNHHLAESIFKGVGRAIGEALLIEGDELLSTKGVL